MGWMSSACVDVARWLASVPDGSGVRVPTMALISSAGVPGPEGWATDRRRLADAAGDEPCISIRCERAPQHGASQHRPGTPGCTVCGVRDLDWEGALRCGARVAGRPQLHEHDHAAQPGRGNERGRHADQRRAPTVFLAVGATPTIDDYLREADALVGSVSQCSRVNENIAESKYEGIHRRATHWPAPWNDIVRHSLRRQSVIATRSPSVSPDA